MRVASALVMASLDAPAGPRPTLLWTHGTTGVAEDCAPTLLPDPVAAGGMPAVEQALDRGWAVVAPDYTGLGTEGPHPYLIGSPEATSSLDAVRAARQLAGLELGEETVVWGHSQGGGAALWVGIEAPRYAPDVPLAGVAGLAPAGDLVSLAAGLQRSPGGNLFATYVLSAYADWYEDVAFEDYVRPAALTTARAIASRCINEPAVFLSVAALLPGEGLFARDLASGPLRERLAQNVPGEPTSTPTFVGQGEADELVLPDVQRRFAQRLCEGGQAIDYRSYAGRDHVSVVADDSPLVPALLRWTEARFAGETPAPGCAFRRG